MSAQRPTFFVRIGLAFVAFFRTLSNPEFAASLRALPEPEPSAPPPDTLHEAPTESALQLLAALQRQGRLLDFIWEDVTDFSDAEVGAAARVVHDGAKRALAELFEIVPVRSEEEGASVVLEADYDARAVRVVGDVRGDPPFRGTLAHAGWRVLEVHLPQLAEGHDLHIVTPAEVEL